MRPGGGTGVLPSCTQVGSLERGRQNALFYSYLTKFNMGQEIKFFNDLNQNFTF